jgi:hypothetical protein
VCAGFTTVSGDNGDGNHFVSPGASPTKTPFASVDFSRAPGAMPLDSTLRYWGNYPTGTYPGTGRGGCTKDGDCLFWDVSLKKGTPLLNRNITPPATNSALEHRWYTSTAPTAQADCDYLIPGSTFDGTAKACITRHLKLAVEIIGDEIGNENGLCESNEACVLSPNIGAYQGHGAFLPPTTFSNAEFTGITLYKRSQNGY